MADGGGGINLNGVPNITISKSIIRDNISDYSGGGLYVSQVPDPDFGVGDGLVISDSSISGNFTDSGGGGVFSDLSKIKFIRTRITGNTAVGNGGALARPSAGNTAYFENCILADNQGALGGMAKLNGGTLDIINSTIANNRSTSLGGAIYNQLATITIRNSILWGNQAATLGHIASFNGGSMTITDSIIESGGYGNFTNLPYFNGNVTPVVSGFASEDDPWFVGDGNYHIQAFSPAVDNAVTDAPALDIDGQSRPEGAGDDIGADEYMLSGNAAPKLAWTEESGYETDGVEPNSVLIGGDSVVFRVRYTDAENDAPWNVHVQVWTGMTTDSTSRTRSIT
jgi:hypothetical protein